jgi:hypothetical protein
MDMLSKFLVFYDVGMITRFTYLYTITLSPVVFRPP